MSKKSRLNSNRVNQPATSNVQAENPDYLPYSAYNNKVEQLQQKPQEDIINPIKSSHATNPKQPTVKPKKRHSLKLTGEVNLGTNKFTNKRRQKHHKTEKPNDSLSNIAAAEDTTTMKIEAQTNAGRHHHVAPPHQEEEPQEEVVIAATTKTTTTTTTTTQEAVTAEPTTQISEIKRKLDEKAERRERLKEKLANLTHEEKQIFLLMKQQRAEARKRKSNNTS